jgi:hypothetical protein
MELKVIVRGLWDRVGGWLLIALGALALLLGWFGVADTALTSEQLPYVVSGGLVGLALIGTGATLLISSDLRDEWAKLDDIEQAIQRLGDLTPPPPPAASDRVAAPRRARASRLHADN